MTLKPKMSHHDTHLEHRFKADPAYEEWFDTDIAKPTENELNTMEASISSSVLHISANTLNYQSKEGA